MTHILSFYADDSLNCLSNIIFVFVFHTDVELEGRIDTNYCTFLRDQGLNPCKIKLNHELLRPKP